MFNSDKKGVSESGLWTIIGAVLAVLVILLATYAFFRLGGSFFSESGEDEVMNNNFNVLAKEVESLLKEKKQYSASNLGFGIPLQIIDDKYILVGFDKDWKGNSVDVESCSTALSTRTIEKPAQCSSKACLCLYEDNIDLGAYDFDQEDVFLCRTFEEKIEFLGKKDSEFSSNDGLNDGFEKVPSPSEEYLKATSEEYEFLVIYGNCDGAWGNRPLFIDRFYDNSTKTDYIYITERTENTKKRYQDLFLEYGNKEIE